jgi:uncharacterized protein YecE (DUF72 family)
MAHRQPLTLPQRAGRTSPSRETAPPRIGCSGWNYKSWRGPFYPVTLPPSSWLDFYSQRFDTVEVNNTFYRLPLRSTFATWGRGVPHEFLFAVKASRFITHMKKLRDPDEPLARLVTRASALGGKLGPVLYQVPATLVLDLDRLDTFLRALPVSTGGHVLRHVIEFRDPSWYVTEVFDLLRHREVAMCLHDKLGSAIDRPFIGPFVYLRFHGPSGAYSGSYSAATLRAWARRLADEFHDGREVFAYFNNDPDAVAVRNALTLRDEIDGLA